MLKIHRWFILVGVIFIVFIFLSIDFNSSKIDSRFNKWVKEYVKTLDSNSISESTIKMFAENVKPNYSLIENQSNEKTSLPLPQELDLKINESLVLQSQIFYRDNLEKLKEVEKAYKVPAPLIVAILGIGSNFGLDMGNHKVIDTLSTMAFLNPNDPKYAKELSDFLTLVSKQYVSIDALGKKNGNFSQLSIPPSLYVAKGVDANNDGNIDLIGSVDDSMATIASILAVSKWGVANTWGNQVVIPQSLDLQTQQGVQNARSVEDWKALGLLKNDGGMLPMLTSKATLILLSNKSYGVLLYDNFNVIYSINNSLVDSLAIGLLSDKISDYDSILNYSKKVKPVSKPTLEIPKPKEEKITISDKYKDIIK